jgi:putative protein-disulfide isomerase
MSNHLYYIHDPMCSWCYAFNASWKALQSALPAEVQVIHLLGGLAPDTTEHMPITTQKMIQQAWRQIEKTVPSVSFNNDFWVKNTPLRSTYPACRAVLAARKQGDMHEQKMIQAIQTAYYQNAENPSLAVVLQQCAGEIGLDVNIFTNDLDSSKIAAELQQEIQLARKMEVCSYPSLCLQRGAELFAIQVNYLDHRRMLGEIVDLLNEPLG